MTSNDTLNNNILFDEWLTDLKTRHETQAQWIKYFEDHPHLDDDQIRRLDSTLKKVTAFMKRVKTIGSTVTPESLLPELAKLNLSKFVDEIASIVCDAKVKVEELPPLIEFCVKAASIYAPFADNLVAELKKRVPTRKSDEITNASKLRVDLKFISDLILNGVIGLSGVQLFGSVLAFVINTDKQEHINMPIILPFCQTNLFDCSGMVPLSCRKTATESDLSELNELLSLRFTPDQRSAIANLVKSYVLSLIEHLSSVRVKMNTILKSIKRQERTKGDALPEDRQAYEEQKTLFTRLHVNAVELSQWTGIELSEMPEELSDDEVDEVEGKKLTTGAHEVGIKLFQDDDTRVFYEKLVNVEQAMLTASPSAEDEIDEDTSDFVENQVENLVENINMSDLEETSAVDEDESDVDKDGATQQEEEFRQKSPAALIQEEKANATREQSILNPLDNAIGMSLNINMFLNKLGNAINKERIDAAALEFIGKFNTKGNRKRVIQHLLAAPHDRLDLLPFYCRFMATIKPAVPEVPFQVERTLLEMFRDIANKKSTTQKGKKPREMMNIDSKVHLSKYISELVKFNLLPCAEGLACLRSLLVDLRQHKVDMICAMIESMGYFLYNLSKTHAKMKIIIEVLMNKISKIKDERQKFLLENAYFAVVPPSEEENMPLQRRPPLEEYIIMKVITGSRPVGSLRRLDWTNEEVVDFALNLLTDPCVVPFEKIERLTKIIGGLSDYHEWIGVFVVDDVIEYIRLALEVNDSSMHQRLFSSIVFIGQLYNYTLCGNAVVFKILYQLISFGLSKSTNTVNECALRTRRIRLAIELVRTVGEYFTEKRPKERMDCFLNYLFLFFYDADQRWKEHAKDFGEFPRDIAYELNKLLSKFRPKEKANFATSLEQAQEIVNQMEEKYKDQAEELLKQTSQFSAPIMEPEDERPKINVCEEEDEDDVALGDNGMDLEESPNADNISDLGDTKFEHDEEEINISGPQQLEVQPEDEEFLRDLDRAIMETFQNASNIPKVPVVDLEVPPSARQKFERKLTFADDTKSAVNNDNTDQSTELRVQMALMTKKGNRTVLKSVNLEPTQGMHEALLEQKARQRQQREEVKQLTLALDQQMAIRQQQAEIDRKAQQLSNA